MNLHGWEEIYGTAICLARRQDMELTYSGVKNKLTIKSLQEGVNFNSNNQLRILSLGVYILYSKSKVTLSQLFFASMYRFTIQWHENIEF